MLAKKRKMCLKSQTIFLIVDGEIVFLLCYDSSKMQLTMGKAYLLFLFVFSFSLFL